MVFWGLISGSIYTFLAVGLNIIFGVMKVVNFAHGEIMIMGAYMTFFLHHALGVNSYFLVPLSVIYTMGIGMVIERVSFKPVKGTSKLNEVLMSLALILILQNIMAIASINYLKELRPVLIASPYRLDRMDLVFAKLPYDFVIILGVAFVVLVGLFFLITRTKFGRRLRAVSQNRLGASLLAIDLGRMDMLSFGMGSALAGMAGSLLGLLTPFDPYSGTPFALRAFTVVVLGGLGSISGAVLAGFILGLSESATGLFFGGAWKEAVAFAFLIAILTFRPQGIRGERS